MGYRTKFELTASDDLDAVHKNGIAETSRYGEGINLFDDEIKWYDHEKDMIAYSRKFPEVEFRLDGTGEESEDIWVKWFKNGAMQTWRLSVDRPINPPTPWPITRIIPDSMAMNIFLDD